MRRLFFPLLLGLALGLACNLPLTPLPPTPTPDFVMEPLDAGPSATYPIPPLVTPTAAIPPAPPTAAAGSAPPGDALVRASRRGGSS